MKAWSALINDISARGVERLTTCVLLRSSQGSPVVTIRATTHFAVDDPAPQRHLQVSVYVVALTLSKAQLTL